MEKMMLEKENKKHADSSRYSRNNLPAITGEIDRKHAIFALPDTLLPWRPTILSYTASLASTVVGFPLDSIKTRMQTHYFKGPLDCLKKTMKHEGFKGLYRGISAPLLSISFSKSMGVSLYTYFKPRIGDVQQTLLESLVPSLLINKKELTEKQQQRYLTLMNIPTSFFSGSITGVCVSFFACPFEFTKLYSQIALLENLRATKSMGVVTTTAAAASGVVASSSTSTTNVGVNNSSKSMSSTTTLSESAKSPELISQAVKKAQSPALNKKLLKEAPSTIQVTKEIVKAQGVLGLYSGIKFHLIREFISSGLYFAVYETAKLTLNSTISDPEGHLKGTNISIGPIAIAVAGALSGVISWVTIFPIDTVKSLTQRDIVSNIIRRQNGLDPIYVKRKLTMPTRRMYRGLSVSVSRSILNSIVFFGAFEYLMKHIA